MSSGSDPHLLALLRAIRLRRAAPEAAAAGAADVEAALGAQPDAPGRNASGLVHLPELPPVQMPLGLPPGPAAADPDGSAAGSPANADPFAQGVSQPAHDGPADPGPARAGGDPGSDATAAQSSSAPHRAYQNAPAVSPLREQVDVGVVGAEGDLAPPGAGPLHEFRAGVDPFRSGPRRARPPSDGTPRGALSRGGALGPAGGLPARGYPGPQALVPGPPAPHPPAPPAAGPTGGVPEIPPTWKPGATPPPVPHHTAGLVPIAGPGAPIGRIAALSAVGRPVPGQHPEPPNPGTLPPRVRPAGPVPALHGPAAISPAAPGAPVDGMNPADDAALREVQRLLGNSLSLAGGTDEVAGRLRAALVQAQPQLMAMLPGNPQYQREQLAQALTWLVHNLDHPPLLVAGCTQLGAALAECGVRPPQLQLIGAALAEAMRAGMANNGWRQDFDEAWRSTWQHVHEWIVHGEALTQYQPTAWTAVVESHEVRRPDLAVIRFRPYLPMPFRAGQYAHVEVGELPGVWRPYSLAGAPRRDNIVELHVRAKTEAGVSGSLVYRTRTGDKVRFGRAEGAMTLPDDPARDLLLVAGDTGVAPLKALLIELAATGDQRSAVLFWGVRTLDELYDIDEIAEIARAAHRATVIPVVSEGEAGPYASGLVTDAIAAYGEWSGHEVYLAGPPLMLAATGSALRQLGVDPERIHHDAPEG